MHKHLLFGPHAIQIGQWQMPVKLHVKPYETHFDMPSYIEATQQAVWLRDGGLLSACAQCDMQL